MAEHGTDPDHDGTAAEAGPEDDTLIAAEGDGTEVPETVPDAYQQATGASAAVRGAHDPDA